MKLLDRVLRSEKFLLVLVGLAIVGWYILRNGTDWVMGKSGGAYWDNMSYCKQHADGKMNLYGSLVSCHSIMSQRKYCRAHLEESTIIDGVQVGCHQLLDKEPEDEPTFWDRF